MNITVSLIIALPLWCIACWFIHRDFKKTLASFFAGLIPFTLGFYLRQELSKPASIALNTKIDSLVRALADREATIDELQKQNQDTYASILKADIRNSTESMSRILETLPDRIKSANALVEKTDEVIARATLDLHVPLSYFLDQFDLRVRLASTKYPFDLKQNAVTYFTIGEQSARDIVIRRAQLPSGNSLVVEMRPGTADFGRVLSLPTLRLVEEIQGHHHQLEVCELHFGSEQTSLGVSARFPELRRITSEDAMSDEMRSMINQALDQAFTSILIKEGTSEPRV